MIVSNTLGALASYEQPRIRAEFDPVAHRAEVRSEVAAIVARFERLHGALPAQ